MLHTTLDVKNANEVQKKVIQLAWMIEWPTLISLSSQNAAKLIISK